MFLDFLFLLYLIFMILKKKKKTIEKSFHHIFPGSNFPLFDNKKQVLDKVVHDIMNYQNQGLSYLLKLRTEASSIIFLKRRHLSEFAKV